ncbi:MAG TPA: D-tyrosyl-tRNA(Tyr) deacylase [Firmicutes bacterium]|nr:D-tyrosyl-tRNA(Tyr) deacylase [Bacillota bacterium]
MKCVVQKVNEASVTVDNKLINKIDRGLLVLVGFTDTDTEKELEYCVRKIVNLRIFEDENDVMNKSVLDCNGEILSISQFTLYGDVKKGNRPSYVKALSGDKALPLYEKFNKMLNEHIKTYDGIFGADMKIKLLNDGPTTIIIDTDNN